MSVGDRVATFDPARGAYADIRNVAGTSLFRLPEDISDEVAAAALLKSCATEFLVNAAGGSSRAKRCWSTRPQAGSGCYWCNGSKRVARQ
ncbi:MAG: hypothetical protein MK060_19690 [Blastomonas sp.]|nr:hypothetical protein [Blastomonas sp.]